MTNKPRIFQADYIKQGNAVGIGIAETDFHNYNEIIAIQSLYVNKDISNRDASIIVFQRIYDELDDGELAILRMVKYTHTKGWDAPYRMKLRVRHVDGIRGQVYQTELLARDALSRKTDIEERFEEPFLFSVIEQEREEKASDKDCEKKKPRITE